MSDTPKLLLHCDAASSVFTLTLEGAEWREKFSSLKAAFAHATIKVTKVTPISIYNEMGRLLVTSTVAPAVSEPVAVGEQ